MPDGSLYLSTAAVDGPDQTKNTLADCDGKCCDDISSNVDRFHQYFIKYLFSLTHPLDVCKALFGETLTLGNGDGHESWKTDRPMRKEGFNIGKFQIRGFSIPTLGP